MVYDVIQKQNQTIDGLIHDPNWGVGVGDELLKRFAHK